MLDVVSRFWHALCKNRGRNNKKEKTNYILTYLGGSKNVND